MELPILLTNTSTLYGVVAAIWLLLGLSLLLSQAYRSGPSITLTPRAVTRIFAVACMAYGVYLAYRDIDATRRYPVLFAIPQPADIAEVHWTILVAALVFCAITVVGLIRRMRQQQKAATPLV